MPKYCQGCGGILGRDCFNEHDCIMISQSQNFFHDREREADTDQLHYELNQVCSNLADHVDRLHEAVNIMKDLKNGGLNNLAVDEFIERYEKTQLPITLPDDLPF
jgi:hypothetical protein